MNVFRQQLYESVRHDNKSAAYDDMIDEFYSYDDIINFFGLEEAQKYTLLLISKSKEDAKNGIIDAPISRKILDDFLAWKKEYATLHGPAPFDIHEWNDALPKQFSFWKKSGTN